MRGKGGICFLVSASFLLILAKLNKKLWHHRYRNDKINLTQAQNCKKNGESEMMQYDVFVSYRRDGGEALACLISERLKQRKYQVFYDVESLRTGKFNQEIYQMIKNCKDVICILPEHGLDRCSDPEDWVRKEIAFAIENEKNIIPIMMRNFEFPKELPTEIDELRNYQAINTGNMEYFDTAFENLLSRLISSKNFKNSIVEKYITNSELRAQYTEYMEEIRCHNSISAMADLAQFYYDYITSPDINEEMFQMCQKAANVGNRKAQNLLGLLYTEGRGTEQNPVKAFEWFYRAAIDGEPNAQKSIATSFRNTTIRNNIAFYWYEQAAIQGDEQSMLQCIWLYDGPDEASHVYRYVDYLIEKKHTDGLYRIIKNLWANQGTDFERGEHILQMLASKAKEPKAIRKCKPIFKLLRKIRYS